MTTVLAIRLPLHKSPLHLWYMRHLPLWDGTPYVPCTVRTTYSFVQGLKVKLLRVILWCFGFTFVWVLHEILTWRLWNTEYATIWDKFGLGLSRDGHFLSWVHGRNGMRQRKAWFLVTIKFRRDRFPAKFEEPKLLWHICSVLWIENRSRVCKRWGVDKPLASADLSFVIWFTFVWLLREILTWWLWNAEYATIWGEFGLGLSRDGNVLSRVHGRNGIRQRKAWFLVTIKYRKDRFLAKFEEPKSLSYLLSPMNWN